MMKVAVVYRLVETARSVISRMPACTTYPFANIAGDVMFHVWGRGRRNMIKAVANSLDLDVNDPKVRNTARHCMRNFCKYAVDLFRYSYPKDDFFRKQVNLVGRENLDDALEKGNGIILVSFHTGNLDLGIRSLSKLGYPVNAIVENLESGQLDMFVQNPRSKSGVKLINLKENRDTSSALVQALRKNEILAMMIDCPNCVKGVKVKLGQKWVLFPSGAATLALRTGARLVPCGLFRTSNTTFKGIIGKAIEYHPSGKIADDMKEITQKLTQELEGITRSFIDQWYVFHPLINDELQDSSKTSDSALTAAN
jgi:lauroyl/myristoyl acyltransferase